MSTIRNELTVYQSEGFPPNGIFDLCAWCLLVAAGCDGCWLVAVVVVVVGVTPRIVQVDILAKVLYFQELLDESDFGK